MFTNRLITRSNPTVTFKKREFPKMFHNISAGLKTQLK